VVSHQQQVERGPGKVRRRSTTVPRSKHGQFALFVSYKSIGTRYIGLFK